MEERRAECKLHVAETDIKIMKSAKDERDESDERYAKIIYERAIIGIIVLMASSFVAALWKLVVK
jgi:hypothetical protein